MSIQYIIYEWIDVNKLESKKKYGSLSQQYKFYRELKVINQRDSETHYSWYLKYGGIPGFRIDTRDCISTSSMVVSGSPKRW